jgi:uncharacterized protein (TIGR02453 family)
MPERYFTPATLTFLAQLARHNDRLWFKANQARYEEAVRQPALRFILAVAPHLRRVSEHLVADPRPVGGSLFRIQRDVRFGADKRPYKTHLGIQFRHDAGKDVHAPGLYLHIEPGNAFVACGVWRPDAAALLRIRSAIAETPVRWKRVRQSRRFTAAYVMDGEALQRPPRGFDPEHPWIEDLKRKDFVGVASLTPAAVTRADFLPRFVTLCKAAEPLQRFLCEALGLEY